MLADGVPALTAARQGSKRLVMSVDARAAALGLRAGMAVAHAQALVPDLAIAEADPAGDAAALNRLAAWCLRHTTPLAAANPPDGVWMDVTGCTHLFGGEAELLAGLVARLAQSGMAARAAIADTPGAAHALARYGANPIAIDPPGMRTSLLPLPIAALRAPEDSVAALRSLGFDTVGQLMAAPRAPLAKRFGATVLRRLDQATGAVPEPIEPATPPEMPRTRQGFPEPIATPEDLARAAALLAERLCEKLQQRGLGASRLDLVFRRVDGTDQAVRIGTAAPTRDTAHLTRLLTARIETIDPGFGIEAACLSAPLTAALGARQSVSDLCVASRAPDLSGLIDTLVNRLGEDRVFRMAPVQSDVPERSVRAIAPLGRVSANWPARLPRPPRLFTPVSAMALLPDHAPAQFTWRRAHRVRCADGPERVFGEWWCDDAETWAVRDYFRVEDEGGQRFWLFRRGDGVQGGTGDLQWFLHGMFG